ncbi:MAG: hypothetical protein JXB05_33110 [Myxococcaceae bacterium]|nr:hypothetical protein [Myxococcaceae bacterium]
MFFPAVPEVWRSDGTEAGTVRLMSFQSYGSTLRAPEPARLDDKYQAGRPES